MQCPIDRASLIQPLTAGNQKTKPINCLLPLLDLQQICRLYIGYPLKSYLQIPLFTQSNWKFPCKHIRNFTANIVRIRVFATWPLLVQTNSLCKCVFPAFWQNFQIPCVFPDRECFGPFPLVSRGSTTEQRAYSVIRSPK